MATVSMIQGNVLPTETTQPSTGILQTAKEKWNNRKVEILLGGASALGGTAALAVALAVGSVLWPVALAVSALGLAALIHVAFFYKVPVQEQPKPAPTLPEPVVLSVAAEEPPAVEAPTTTAAPVVEEAPLALSYSDYLLAASNGVQLAGLMGGVTAPVVIGANVASSIAQYMMLPADATKLQKAGVALPLIGAPVLRAYPMVSGALQACSLVQLAKRSGGQVANALSQIRKSPLNALKVGGIHMFNLLSGTVLAGATLVRGYKSIGSDSAPVKGALPKVNGTDTCDSNDAPIPVDLKPVNGTQTQTPRGTPIPVQFFPKDTCPMPELEASTALVAQNTPFLVKGQWMINIPGRGTHTVNGPKLTPAELEVITQLQSRQTVRATPRAIAAPQAENSTVVHTVSSVKPAVTPLLPKPPEAPKVFVKGFDDTIQDDRDACAEPERDSFVGRQLARYDECICLRTAWHDRNAALYARYVKGMAREAAEEVLDFINPVECPESLIPGPRRK